MMTQPIYVSVQLKTSNLVPKEIKRKRTYFTSPLALLYVKDPLYSLRSQEFLFKNLNVLHFLRILVCQQLPIPFQFLFRGLF